MITLQIDPQDATLSNLLANLEAVSTRALPKTVKAIGLAAKVISYTWKSYALGSPIPGTVDKIKNPTGGYAKSIKIKRLSPFSVLIYSNSSIASMLEDGTKQYDMKKTHPLGKKSRVTKKGTPYLIVPFRHGTPDSKGPSKLPQHLYDMIKQQIKEGEAELSRVAGEGIATANAAGDLIPRTAYAWGSRFSAGIDRLEGLVAFDVSTGSSNRTTFLTFRVISVNSPAHKWINPATRALKLTSHVSENTKSIVSSLIRQGIREDLGI